MTENILRKDNEWSVIDGELCKVVDFRPMATIRDGKVVAPNLTDPYALVVLECKKFPEKIQGYITHKMDFTHLWAAFRDRGINESEEILIIWTVKQYKYRLVKYFASFYPKLWVVICPIGAFRLMTDSEYLSELRGEARFLAEKPIVEWKPAVMK